MLRLKPTTHRRYNNAVLFPVPHSWCAGAESTVFTSIIQLESFVPQNDKRKDSKENPAAPAHSQTSDSPNLNYQWHESNKQNISYTSTQILAGANNTSANTVACLTNNQRCTENISNPSEAEMF